MADSSSVHATSHILPIRPQQSLIIDLTPHSYDAFIFPIIECLKYSPIAPALTRAEAVPMEFLSQIFATAHCDKVVDRIFFDVFEHKASISKQRFCTLLGFESDSLMVNPETIPMGHLFNMFYNMGYTKVLPTVTKFKKSCLPPQWNGMFTVLFKGLSERSAGSDGSSRLFLSIMYGVYNGINMDYGSVLWQQLIQSLSSTSRHSEISYARFWILVTKWVMDKYHIPIVAGAPMSSIGTFHPNCCWCFIVSDTSKFPFNGSIPETMYGDVPADSRIIRTYKEFKRSGPRELTQEMLKSIHDANKPVTRGKKPVTRESSLKRCSEGQEAHDPILNYSVRRDLAEKLAPALSLLSKIEGLVDFVSIPKQGGEKETMSQPPPTSTETHTTELPPVGHASGSGVKDKGKKIAEESGEDDKETIADLLKCQGRDKEVDISTRVAREAEEAERKQKEAHDLLESRKTLFPSWTLERLIKEAIDTPNILWLEPVISLDRSNTVDSQFDMPLTRKAFIFHAFSNIAEFPHPHPKFNRDLIEFYLKEAQPQYQTWSAQKIVNVRVLKPYREGNFTNVRFMVLRGSAKTEHPISLADLPNLNPHDWIILHNILLINEAEYGPIIDHFKRMLVCYIMEVALMEQEIASVFKKKPTISPVGSASDLNLMQMGKIDPKRNSIIFTRNEGQKCLFALADKHLYTTTCLEHVLGIIHRCKQNTADDIKYFDDMIQWYIRFRQTILALISCLFDTTKKVPAAGPSKKKK
ncbi:hypothetical protein Lser_V15G23655 [Lactuca serriola]